MAAIFPFSALRPVPEAAHAVAAVPYDVVSSDEARALAEGNPLSFLRVSRAEIEFPPSTDPHADVIYERAAENFRDLRSRAPLVEEDHPTFYVYQLDMAGHVQTGLAACFAIDEYDDGLIKKHEKTRPDKEDDRTRHMIAIGAQTGPVFLIYAAAPAIDDIVARTSTTPPLFDFVAPDGVRHTIWTVLDGEHAALTAAFAAVPALYIADGHHRAASAARARRALAGRGQGEHDRVLAVAFPDNQVQILPYNRVVRDLGRLTPTRFLEQIGQRLTIEPGASRTPQGKGHVTMYLNGTWYGVDLNAPAPEGATALDVSMLEETVLRPVLGIEDVRTDQRIDFVGGIRGTAELQRLVDSGDFAVAFALHPVTVRDLMAVSDAGGIMPPKSTWFEPKLRDGLLSHLI
jgi:uncharacterized protein (DUF1015 family)